MTKTFSRGLECEFVQALNKAYDEQDSWWRTLVDDKELFVGIRKNYINIYFNGGSILELRYSQSKGLFGSAHFKYLLNLTRENARRDYVTFKNGKFDPVAVMDSYTDIGKDIGKIKNAVKRHQGDEKKGVHQISVDNGNVIDVEIQFPGAKGRIDFAALQKINGEIKVVFFEAKLYSNGELRSPSASPRIFGQIMQYENILSSRRDEIKKSYAQVAKNIVQINGWDRRRDNIFFEAANGNLSVDPKVRLAIFGFDDPQKSAANSPDGLFSRMRAGLDEARVLAKGNPHDFRSAIRSPE